MGRGRQTANTNVGFQIDLFSTPISNHCATRILNCTNKLNKETFKEIRQTLEADNKTIGRKDPKSVRIERYTCYKNPLFNSE